MAKNQKNYNSRIRSKRSKFKRTKVLITGSEGFIGSAITKELLKRKLDIYGIGKKKRNITKYKYFNLDLYSSKETNDFFNKYSFDTIIHTAWVTNPNTMRNSKLNNKWLEISKRILNLHKKNNGDNFYCVGTSDEYSRIINKSNKCVENKSKISDLNTYAKNKVLFYKYLKKSKINYIWFRVFWLFGDNENHKRVFPEVINKLSNDKKVLIENPNIGLDYTYVGDAAKMIVKVIFKSKESSVFNICSGNYKNLGEIANEISLILKKQKFLKFKKSKINTKIYGSIKKLKQYKCYIKSNFKSRLREFVLKLSKTTS